MKRCLLPILLAATLPNLLAAQPTHLDIMVPDLKDTDLKGRVKSIELKVCHDVSDEFSTEKNEYDRTGNLVKITEHDEKGKLVGIREFFYDESGCYSRQHYKNEKKGYENDWQVTLSSETRQIALREKDGRIGLETYSPEGYLISYQLMNKDKKQLLAFQYARDGQNRRLKRTRIEGSKPANTYFYKWAENGFINMERQTYHGEKAERLHTYEYLLTDSHGNWTQRIMVRYDVGGKEKKKLYENTVVRKIEYYEDEENAAEKEPSPEEETHETE